MPSLGDQGERVKASDLLVRVTQTVGVAFYARAVTAETPHDRDRGRLHQAVTYATVGASQAADLLRYPPPGYQPLEQRRRIGHGDERWAFAVDELLSGGVYRGAGLGVRVTAVTAQDAALTYQPVAFDDEGDAVEAAQVGVDDEVYTARGDRHFRPGDVVVAGLPVAGRLWFPVPMKVVLLEQEPSRVMYAVGTLPGHPFAGEEAFAIEQTADGSVWMTVRSFARPATWWSWPLRPVMGLMRSLIARRFLTALIGPIPPSTT